VTRLGAMDRPVRTLSDLDRSLLGARGPGRRQLLLPSAGDPMVALRTEGPLVRYAARNLLWVPPGDGPIHHIAAIVAVRVLRLPGLWFVAVVAAAAQDTRRRRSLPRLTPIVRTSTPWTDAGRGTGIL
jgi:hypothetical protein